MGKHLIFVLAVFFVFSGLDWGWGKKKEKQEEPQSTATQQSSWGTSYSQGDSWNSSTPASSQTAAPSKLGGLSGQDAKDMAKAVNVVSQMDEQTLQSLARISSAMAKNRAEAAK